MIRHAAELHDVGKVAVPDAILHKPAALDERSGPSIREHTLIGEKIIAAAPDLARVARLVRSSHENYDGTGYPDGLARREIPLGSRIIAVCDAFDAMTTDRPYREAMDEESAVASSAAVPAPSSILRSSSASARRSRPSDATLRRAA